MAQAQQLSTQANTATPPTARQLNGHPNIPQGGLFNLPGITYWSEQTENNDQATATAVAATSVAFQFQQSLANTDILYRIMIDVTITTSNEALAGGAVANSAYVPYNYIAAIQLSMQNQFNSYDVPSGADAKIFDLIRPAYPDESPNNYEDNPITQINSPQTNMQVLPLGAPPSQIRAAHVFGTTAATSFNFDIPLGIWFDRYFDLEPDGSLVNLAPVRAFVTPQLMSGTNRVVTPRITLSPILAATRDQGPFVVTAGAPTVVGGDAVVLGFQRKVIYQPKSHTDTPILWGWQYSRETRQYTVAGRTTIDIQLPTTGQLLSLYYRFFDPSAASGGSPPLVSTITNCWLQYGSGLFKYQDTAARCQRRWLRQHSGRLPFEGVLIHDMCTDERKHISNQNALNTLDTSSCRVHFDFTAITSATCYVYIGVEALRFVVQQ